MRKEIKEIVLTSLFIALSYLVTLPFKGINILDIASGVIISPMHFIVFLAALLLGPRQGVLVGAIAPIFVSLLSSMPPLIPNAFVMSVELMIYALVSSYLYHKWEKNIYLSLIVALVLGRIAYLIVMAIVFFVGLSETYDILNYLKTLFIFSLPGIVLQIILIPLIIKAINLRINLNNKGESNGSKLS